MMFPTSRVCTIQYLLQQKAKYVGIISKQIEFKLSRALEDNISIQQKETGK